MFECIANGAKPDKILENVPFPGNKSSSVSREIMSHRRTLSGDEDATATTAANSSCNEEENSSLFHGEGQEDDFARQFEFSGLAARDQPELRGELADRAALLSKRESSEDYAVEDYISRSAQSRPASPGGCFSSFFSMTSSKWNPLDATCRSKMMHWSYRVIDYSFPSWKRPRSPGTQRKRTNEALSLVFSSFSLVDRFASRNDLDRTNYKLLCMVCLHLAAKTSGMFSYVDLSPPTHFHPAHIAEDSLGAVSAALQRDSSCAPSSNQAFFSSPSWGAADPPRPPLGLLSINGLASLCRGEFDHECLCHMERLILEQLHWKLTNVSPIEWLHMFLTLSKNAEQNNHLDDQTIVHWDTVLNSALCQLELAIESPQLMTFAPSMLALSSFINAVEEHTKIQGDCVLNHIMEVMGLNHERDELNSLRDILLHS